MGGSASRCCSWARAWAWRELRQPNLGAVVGVSGSLGADVADAAREAFVHAMSRASIVVAIVAALGALFAWRCLPARGADQHSEVDASAGRDDVLATVNS
jgi:hypothetical protein